VQGVGGTAFELDSIESVVVLGPVLDAVTLVLEQLVER